MGEAIFKMIIAISGKMGSGKTTLADALSHSFLLNGLEIQRLKFAGPIYNCATLIQEHLKIPVEKDRQLLQFLGSHFKQKISFDFWTQQLLSQITSKPNTVYIIDDLRFKDEATALKNLGAFLIRLDCPEEERAARVGAALFLNDKHSSELDLDDYTKFDLTLNSSIIPVIQLVKIIKTNLSIKLREIA